MVPPLFSATGTTYNVDVDSHGHGDTTGVVFLLEPDEGGNHLTCDIFEQDCPPGEKCMPWAYDGGGAWDATKCFPVVDDPVPDGEPCHAVASPTSGLDDCEVGSMCWDVDPETLEGVCTPMCVGDESNPYCEDPHRYCAIGGDGWIVLCLPLCSPVEQDCPEGQACYPIQDEWTCAPDASGDAGGYGDPCEFINVCNPGLICLDASTVPPGEACEGAAGCCTEVCDLDDPLGDLQCAGAADGQTCQPWYSGGTAPPGLENVGACALPQ